MEFPQNPQNLATPIPGKRKKQSPKPSRTDDKGKANHKESATQAGAPWHTPITDMIYEDKGMQWTTTINNKSESRRVWLRRGVGVPT
jgi:hypothetical protein